MLTDIFWNILRQKTKWGGENCSFDLGLQLLKLLLPCIAVNEKQPALITADQFFLQVTINECADEFERDIRI